jgi:hypothetical protein
MYRYLENDHLVSPLRRPRCYPALVSSVTPSALTISPRTPLRGHGGPQFMKRGKRGRKSSPKQSLNLPNIDNAKSAVLNSLPSKESQRGYRRSIDEFINWYCSEPRLSFNRAVVTRYRIHLESRQLAPGTINGRLAAVGLRTKLLIPVSSARILLLASGESKGRRTSEFALVTGSPLNRPKRSGRCLTRIRLKASGIERCSGSYCVAGYAGERRQSLRSHTFSDARIIGQSLTRLARDVTLEPCLSTRFRSTTTDPQSDRNRSHQSMLGQSSSSDVIAERRYRPTASRSMLPRVRIVLGSCPYSRDLDSSSLVVSVYLTPSGKPHWRVADNLTRNARY